MEPNIIRCACLFDVSEQSFINQAACSLNFGPRAILAARRDQRSRKTSTKKKRLSVSQVTTLGY
jgi:hypothetical protein